MSTFRSVDVSACWRFGLSTFSSSTGRFFDLFSSDQFKDHLNTDHLAVYWWSMNRFNNVFLNKLRKPHNNPWWGCSIINVICHIKIVWDPSFSLIHWFINNIVFPLYGFYEQCIRGVVAKVALHPTREAVARSSLNQYMVTKCLPHSGFLDDWWVMRNFTPNQNSTIDYWKCFLLLLELCMQIMFYVYACLWWRYNGILNALSGKNVSSAIMGLIL